MIMAVYGTLRKTGRLQSYLGNAQYLGKQRINGFDMYSLGSYPYIVRGGGSILVEVYDVEPEEATNTERMERSAGYTVVNVPTRWGDATMFYMPDEQHQRYMSSTFRSSPPLVVSGDWIMYDRELAY